MTSVFGASDRSVDISWSATPGALSYEVQYFKLNDRKRIKLGIDKVPGTVWNKTLPPGSYALQIRALDFRNVPSKWGPLQNFMVTLPTVTQVVPAIGQTYNIAKDKEQVEVTLTWQSISEADMYHVIVHNSNGKTIYENIMPETLVNIPLRKEGKYFWKVTALADGDRKPSKPVMKHFFSVIPPLNPAPKLDLKVLQKRFIISWKGSSGEKNELDLYRKVDGQWKNILSKKRKSSLKIPKSRLKTGNYRIKLVSYDSRNRASEPAVMLFTWDQSELSSVKKIEQKQRKDSTNSLLSGNFDKTPWYVDLTFTSNNINSTTINDSAEIANKYIGNDYILDINRVTKSNWQWVNRGQIGSYVDALRSYNTFAIKTGAMWNSSISKSFKVEGGSRLYINESLYTSGNGDTEQIEPGKLKTFGIDAFGSIGLKVFKNGLLSVGGTFAKDLKMLGSSPARSEFDSGTQGTYFFAFENEFTPSIAAKAFLEFGSYETRFLSETTEFNSKTVGFTLHLDF